MKLNVRLSVGSVIYKDLYFPQDFQIRLPQSDSPYIDLPVSTSFPLQRTHLSIKDLSQRQGVRTDPLTYPQPADIQVRPLQRKKGWTGRDRNGTGSERSDEVDNGVEETEEPDEGLKRQVGEAVEERRKEMEKTGEGTDEGIGQEPA